MSMSCTTGQLYATSGRQASDTSDVALVRSIAAGDKHAMQILFARHNVRVFRFVLRFVGDRSAAEDLVSEVFLDRPEDSRADLRSPPGSWRLPAIRPFRQCSAG
jgi:RNA polymerase sigma-70 factor, ECF subfamily